MMQRQIIGVTATGYHSSDSPSTSGIIESLRQYIRQWNGVGLKWEEIQCAYGRATVDYEKALNTVNEVEEKVIETIRTYFKPIKDAISSNNEKTRKSLKKEEQKIEELQSHLETVIKQEEEKCKRQSSSFDKEAFVEEAERLKLETGKLATRESNICFEGVVISKVQTEVDKFHGQIQKAMKTFKPNDLFVISESKHEFKARITTPPESCPSVIQSQLTQSTSQSALTPHPPPPRRSKSACSNSRSASSPSSSKTSHSMEITKQTNPKRCNVQMSQIYRPSGATVEKVGKGKAKPTISVPPRKSTVDDQGTGNELDHPYGVGVLSNGNKVVVETNALKIIGGDTNEIIQCTNLYNRDEAKATGCCDLTVLRNDQVIVCDSQRRNLLLITPGKDQFEIFMTFDKGIVPRAITNDGKTLYICLGRVSGGGVLEKVDIETKRIVGPIISLQSPMDSSRQMGASVCTNSAPKYMAVNSRNELLVSDALNGIVWFIDGEENVHSLTKASIPGLSRPTGICWLSSSRFVVAVQESNRHQLLVVDITDINNINVINSLERKGDRPDEFSSPEGMTLYQGHQLLICYLMNSRLNRIPLSFLEDSSSV
eukprot:XP_011673251.1 PREDICTED: uncharacterized protein LOC105442639 [Strongylocentrotus purpuratus]